MMSGLSFLTPTCKVLHKIYSVSLEAKKRLTTVSLEAKKSKAKVCKIKTCDHCSDYYTQLYTRDQLHNLTCE